jgi:hypothetical protein
MLPTRFARILTLLHDSAKTFVVFLLSSYVHPQKALEPQSFLRCIGYQDPRDHSAANRRRVAD